MKNRLLSLIATGAVLFAGSITHGQNFLKVTRTNQEQTINLTTDQVLEIQLPRKSSTGYIWCESRDYTKSAIQKSVAKIGDDDFIHDATTDQIGGSGTQIMRYVGTLAGTTTLTLELRRPNSTINTTIDSYTINVVSSGKYTGTYAPPVKAVHVYDKPLTLTPLSGIPASWDWRQESTPIENQSMCGDCWAFATVGVFECNILEVDGNTRDISEEFVTDCYSPSGYDGCNGTTNSTENEAFQCWMSTYKGANSNGGGAVYESEDYTTCTHMGNTGTCKGPYTPHETIQGFNKIGGSGNTKIDSIQYHIYKHGPVWVEVDASSNNFSLYTGGIFVESGTSTDHCVVLCGWKDTTVSDNSGGYWILRNSWGSGPAIGYGCNNASGYMYISYGSDAVESAASYIVYKGGPSHGAPTAHFTDMADTSSCLGTIQFSDESVAEPTSWSWNFGDGGTSSMQNPSHTYTANGTYTVSLTASNSSGSNTCSKTKYITVNMPAGPSVTNGSAVSGGSVTLQAVGTSTLEWYNKATGGTLVTTGTSYTINPLTTDDTLYVESDEAQTAQSVGMSAKSSNGGYYTAAYRQGLQFDVYAPVIIKSVTVAEQTAGTRTIVVTNSAGVEIDSITASVAAGTAVSVPLNFNVPAGTGYTMWAAASSAFWRDTMNAVYPYTIPGVLSITDNTIDDNWHYYFFYNWQVEPICISPRVPVMATILTGINEHSESNFDLYPNPNTGSFEVKLNDQNVQNATISIANTLGQTVFEKNIMNNNAPIHIDVANLQQGMYYVRIQTDKSTYIRKVLIAN